MIGLLPRSIIARFLAVTSVATFIVAFSATRFFLDEPDELRRAIFLAITITSTIVVLVVWGLGRAGVWARTVELIPQLNRWVFPNLAGTWGGFLRSTYVDPRTGEPLEPIPALMTIRQSILDIHLTMETRGMVSKSLVVTPLVDRGHQDFRISYYYDTERLTTPEHRGAAVLKISTERDQLTGEYFNSNEFKGTLRLARIGEDPDARPSFEDIDEALLQQLPVPQSVRCPQAAERDRPGGPRGA